MWLRRRTANCTHSNGLGQTYTNCNDALGFDSETDAQDAALAYLATLPPGAVGAHFSNICALGDSLEAPTFDSSGTQNGFILWFYTGPRGQVITYSGSVPASGGSCTGVASGSLDLTIRLAPMSVRAARGRKSGDQRQGQWTIRRRDRGERFPPLRPRRAPKARDAVSPARPGPGWLVDALSVPYRFTSARIAARSSASLPPRPLAMIVGWQTGRGDAARRSGSWPSCGAGWPRPRTLLTEAQAASKHAEGAFDAASDRFDAAERVLDAAREDRAQARRDRYSGPAGV